MSSSRPTRSNSESNTCMCVCICKQRLHRNGIARAINTLKKNNAKVATKRICDTDSWQRDGSISAFIDFVGESRHSATDATPCRFEYCCVLITHIRCLFWRTHTNTRSQTHTHTFPCRLLGAGASVFVRSYRHRHRHHHRPLFTFHRLCCSSLFWFLRKSRQRRHRCCLQPKCAEHISRNVCVPLHPPPRMANNMSNARAGETRMNAWTLCHAHESMRARMSWMRYEMCERSKILASQTNRVNGNAVVQVHRVRTDDRIPTDSSVVPIAIYSQLRACVLPSQNCPVWVCLCAAVRF